MTQKNFNIKIRHFGQNRHISYIIKFSVQTSIIEVEAKMRPTDGLTDGNSKL